MSIENPKINPQLKQEGSMESDVAMMKEEIRKLSSLLDEPEYGIFTWKEAVGKQMGKVRDLMDELLPPKE